MDEINPYAPPQADSDGLVTCEYVMEREPFVRALADHNGHQNYAYVPVLGLTLAAVGFVIALFLIVGYPRASPAVSLLFVMCFTASLMGPVIIRYYFSLLPAARRQLAEWEQRLPLAWGPWLVELETDELRLITPAGVLTWPWSQVRALSAETAAAVLVAGELPLWIPGNARLSLPITDLRRTVKKRCREARERKG